MQRRFFGTDGVRGIAGEPPLTPSFVLRLGQAAGAFFRQEGQRPLILVGKDTRKSCDMLEAALAAGLMSQGVAVEHLGILPTPGVAYLTEALGASAGVVISASHNPYQDNGIKFFGPGGVKLSDELEARIEALLELPLPSQPLAAMRSHQEAERLYLDHLLHGAPCLDGLRVAMDAANGATYRVAVRAFQRLGVEVFALFVSPDGKNINAGCGSTHPEALQRIVIEGGFDLGLAFDGDGDRVIFVDRRGRLAHGDHLLYINALARKASGVVVTVMSNMGLELRLKERGIPIIRTQVGDRYVHEALQREGLTLGGEQSGHILFLDYARTGDGILTALLTLRALAASGRDLSEWVDELPMFPQVLLNVAVRDRLTLMANADLNETLQVAKRALPEGRVNVRPSGTESLVRVMVEGPDQAVIQALAEQLAQTVQVLDQGGVAR